MATVSVKLKFANSNLAGQSAITSYKVYRRENQDPYSGTSPINSSYLLATETLTNASPSILEYIDNGATDGKTYYYRVEFYRGSEIATSVNPIRVSTPSSSSLGYPTNSPSYTSEVPYRIPTQPILHWDATRHFKNSGPSELVQSQVVPNYSKDFKGFNFEVLSNGINTLSLAPISNIPDVAIYRPSDSSIVNNGGNGTSAWSSGLNGYVKSASTYGVALKLAGKAHSTKKFSHLQDGSGVKSTRSTDEFITVALSKGWSFFAVFYAGNDIPGGAPDLSQTGHGFHWNLNARSYHPGNNLVFIDPATNKYHGAMTIPSAHYGASIDIETGYQYCKHLDIGRTNGKTFPIFFPTISSWSNPSINRDFISTHSNKTQIEAHTNTGINTTPFASVVANPDKLHTICARSKPFRNSSQVFINGVLSTDGPATDYKKTWTADTDEPTSPGNPAFATNKGFYPMFYPFFDSTDYRYSNYPRESTSTGSYYDPAHVGSGTENHVKQTRSWYPPVNFNGGIVDSDGEHAYSTLPVDTNGRRYAEIPTDWFFPFQQVLEFDVGIAELYFFPDCFTDAEFKSVFDYINAKYSGNIQTDDPNLTGLKT